MRFALCILIGAFFTGSHAEVCVQVSEKYSVCPGDNAYADGYGGTVTGVNPFSMKVTFRQHGYSSSYRTYDLEKVSIGRGCLLNYCIGDDAYAAGYGGRIVGINPFAGQITFLQYGYNSTYHTYRIEHVSVGSLCLDFSVTHPTRLVKSLSEFTKIHGIKSKFKYSFPRKQKNFERAKLNRGRP